MQKIITLEVYGRWSMPNLSFQVESIRAERYNFEAISQLGINVNIMLGKLEKSQPGYRLSFVVKLEYSPPIASIDVKGLANITPSNEEECNSLENGVKSGQAPPAIAASIYSYLFPIIALLSREIGLPPPVPMPVSAPQPEKGEPKGYV
ncbi:MAG: hypothetical protein QW760_00155 [Thermofilaceae archaeon]